MTNNNVINFSKIKNIAGEKQNGRQQNNNYNQIKTGGRPVNNASACNRCY